MPFSLGHEIMDIRDILDIVTKKMKKNDQLNFLSTCKELTMRRTHYLVLKMRRDQKKLMLLANLERALGELNDETFSPFTDEDEEKQIIISKKIYLLRQKYSYLI